MTDTMPALVELVTAPALDELAQLDQWVVWKTIGRQKVPLKRDDSGDKPCLAGASHSEPADWTSYASACRSQAELGGRGIGFVFSDYDPYSGVDLDGCRDKQTGIIEPWAQRWIDALNSYTEISPSQTGVKIWVRGTLPKELEHSLGAHKGIEVYSTHRYFTYTGQHLAGTPAEIRDAQPALDTLWTEYHKEPEPAAPRKAYKVSKGEAANERQNASDVIPRLNRANDLGDYLEHKGATLVRTSGESRYYTGLAGDTHANGTTYIVSPAKDGNGHIGFSYSPNGKLSKADFPRGFRWFDAITALEYSDVIAALKELNPIPLSKAHQAAPQPATVYRTAAQDADAERRRAERRAAAAATRDQLAARAKDDDRLTPCDRATLQAMLDWAAAHNASACWAGRATIARLAGYSLGSVKRSTMLLESYGYFTSEGSGGAFYQTAKRTFTRGSLFADETILDAKNDPRRDPVACEGGALPPARENAPALRQSHGRYQVSDGARFGGWSATEAGAWEQWQPSRSNTASNGITSAEPAEIPCAKVFDDSDQPEAGSYTPIELPSAPYTGRNKHALDSEARYALVWASMRRRDDADTPLPPGVLNLLASGDVDADDPLIRTAPSDPKRANEYWALKNMKAKSAKQAIWMRRRIAELEVLMPLSEWHDQPAPGGVWLPSDGAAPIRARSQAPNSAGVQVALNL